jgi:hypothetical protein
LIGMDLCLEIVHKFLRFYAPPHTFLNVSQRNNLRNMSEEEVSKEKKGWKFFVRQHIYPRLLVFSAGLVVTITSTVLTMSMWIATLYHERITILWIVGVASIVAGIWLIHLRWPAAVSLIKRIFHRCLPVITGIAVVSFVGLSLPEYGLLWSPLPNYPREYDIAMQKLFWILGPPIWMLGLIFLDLGRLKSLRFREKRFLIPFAALIVLCTIFVLMTKYLYMHLDHGQGG